MHRSLQLSLSFLAALVLLLATSAASSAHPAGTSFMKVKPAHTQKPRGTINLYSHGGAIEQYPKVYIIYWGSQWQAAGPAQNYIGGFFDSVGANSWANSTTQYCQGVPAGTVQCGSAGAHPHNLPNQVAGVWADSSNPVPTSPTQSQIAAEASAAVAHFGSGSSNSDADYMVFTPTGHSMNGFGTSWCAWHSSSGNMSYSYMPYQPDAGASCGQNFVNSGSSGYFDGFSIVGGHEYAETITDPYPSSGWLDNRGAENGDKCAWISSGQGAAANMPGTTYAVQSLWSNAFNSGSGGCVLSS